LKSDVIHDAANVVLIENLKRRRNFGNIGSFGDMATGRNFAKNREIA
jgi:hypothetical protein